MKFSKSKSTLIKSTPMKDPKDGTKADKIEDAQKMKSKKKGKK